MLISTSIESMAVLRTVLGLEAVAVPLGAAAHALEELRFGHDRLDVCDAHRQQLLARSPAHPQYTSLTSTMPAAGS